MRHLLLSLALVVVVGAFPVARSDAGQSEAVAEFTQPRVDESSVVAASPAVPGAQEQRIMENLSAARRVGDVEAARALQAELDALHGIERSISRPAADDGEDQVELGEPGGGSGLRWAGDVFVTDFEYDQVEPSIDSAPNGDLYAAVEEDTGWIRIYRSTDGGVSWWWIIAFKGADTVKNPSLTYAERATGEKWVFVAYEATYADNTKAIKVFRVNPDDSNVYDFTTVAAGFYTTPDIYPSICTDYLLYDVYYVYVTYTVNAIDYYPAMFSRSLDYGLTWGAPLNITGGAENSQWVTRPDIAYGTPGLFVAFEKLGWTGSSWDVQVWVTESNNFGTAWSVPIQLTSSSYEEFEPSVAVANGVNNLVVAYTRQFSTDTDIYYAYSTDGGDTYDVNNALPWTYEDENSVDLAVSNYEGRFHAAFWQDTGGWRDYDIAYTYADVSVPDSWSPSVVVNDGNNANPNYPKPAICVNPTEPIPYEACVAWTDMRGTWYDVYFDCGFRGCRGDCNCDGQIDFGDINAFVAALGIPPVYCDATGYNADINGDGSADFGDINPFVDLLTGYPLPIACPGPLD